MSDISLARLLMKVMLLYYDIEAKTLGEFNLDIACPRRTVGGRWRGTLEKNNKIENRNCSCQTRLASGHVAWSLRITRRQL